MDILSPIEEVTCSIAAKLAGISIVVPYIHVLTRTLEKNEDDCGVCTMKGQILHYLKSHFAGIEEKEQLALATMLDPRFKDKFFGRNIIVTQSEKTGLIAHVSRFTQDTKLHE